MDGSRSYFSLCFISDGVTRNFLNIPLFWVPHLELPSQTAPATSITPFSVLNLTLMAFVGQGPCVCPSPRLSSRGAGTRSAFFLL